MKNFDIENLERKNVYKTPDDFYERMQRNVLEQVQPKARIHSIKSNWAYLAAASVALIFGVTFFANQDEAAVRQNQGSTELVSSGRNAVNSSTPTDKPQKEETVALHILEADLTSVVAQNQNEDKNRTHEVPANKTVINNAPRKSIEQNPETQVDQIISNFTYAELADVGRNAEQDIYLDLYN